MSNFTLARYRYCPPLASQFPTIVGTNSENPTIMNTTGRGLHMDFGNNPSGTYSIRGCFKNINAASSQSIIARFEFPGWGWNTMCSGLAVTDGTKYVTHGINWNANGSKAAIYQVLQWTNSTTLGGTVPYSPATYTGGGMEWMRMDMVGGALTNFFVGCNGVDWLEIYSGSQGSFITPTQVGMFILGGKGGGQIPPTGTNLSFLNMLYYSDPDITPAV